MITALRALALILLLISASEAQAQTRATTADLSGVVRDQVQAVLPGVTVSVTNVETNLERTTVTDGLGRFVVPALPPGTYTVRAELSGFAAGIRENISLLLGSAVELDLTLRVAGGAEEITVVGQPPIVDIQRTAVASVVSETQIDSLPINGRNFISFSIITPGVTVDRTPQQGASATSGLTFAGQRARSNNITVDGLDNNDSTVGSVRATFSQEAVREFQVLTNSYSAEFGKASGGVVNIVTKSGTNTPAGNAFFFFRDETLNAKEHFEKFNPAGQRIDREKAPYSQKQFGGTFGGPLKRDRSFVFLSFERLDIQANNFVNIDDRTPLTLFGQPIGTAADVLRRNGFPVETGNVPYDVESDQFLAKVDHQITPTQQLTVRFNWAGALNENIEPWGGQVANSRGARLDSTDYMGGVSHVAVPSARTVNDLRFLIASRDQEVNSLDPNCNGPCLGEDQGGPTLEVVGVASVGRQRFTPQPRENARLQVLDTLSYYASGHQIKFGFDYSYIDHRKQSLPLHFGGRYIFAPLPAIPGVLPAPVTAIQALALGLPGAYVQGYGTSSAIYGASDLSLFGQDDWRPRPNLTLKLGVRYQRQFWPANTFTAPGLAPYRFPSDTDNLAPRLGFSWDPKGDHKTSIHGAYGLFYDNHITGLYGIADIVDGTAQGVRTLVARFPASLAGWRAPGHRLSEQTASALFGDFPSLMISIHPELGTPYAHHAALGMDRELAGSLSLSANFIYARGFDQVGTIDYNPLVPALGPGRRPLDRVNPATGQGVPGTSASVLQYTSFGETWYRGLTLSLSRRFADSYQFTMSYTLSKAEDNSTDFQSAFIPQRNGRGRNPDDPAGLPIGFNPDDEKGPSLQDQRHRFVWSGLVQLPAEIQATSIVTVASGRPYNILAGFDVNGDGDGGAFPSDRARANPEDEATSIGRNAGTMPMQATIDVRLSRRFHLGGSFGLEGLFEVFNLFNRSNFTEINNIFGTLRYPGSPLPTFAQFEQAAPPLQVQLALKLHF